MRILALLIFCTQAGCAASPAEPAQPGLMLRPGNWDGDIGTYQLPPALQAMRPGKWPNDGWQRLVISGTRATIESLPTPARQRPPFLAIIAAQVTAAQAGRTVDAMAAAPATPPPESELYLRLPGQPLRRGDVALYRFKNGTATLTPRLDFRYELTLGSRAFAFTVRNAAQGARYSIEYDGNGFEYSLPEYGWDSRIKALADFDGDGKPDFLIEVAGNNSVYEHLLLSSQARPGPNPASASLQATGC